MVKQMSGAQFADMVAAGAVNLKRHAKEINDLNVFPIPDGDTGDNMLLTLNRVPDAARKRIRSYRRRHRQSRIRCCLARAAIQE